MNKTDLLKRAGAFSRAFARDEEGGIIVLTLLLLFTMLVVGGMAVDFMRFESQRAELQSVSDRAVLAAADLDQSKDPKEVVIDFFEKAGWGDNIVGEPNVDPVGGDRVVSVDAEVDVNTFFLRLIGIDELTAGARSSAIEGTGSVEISLILDISGSMRHSVNIEGRGRVPRITLLQEAATAFIDDLLLEEYDGRISVNLIAYSQQVSLGDDLYRAIKTTPDTAVFGSDGGMISGSSYSSFAEEGDEYYGGGINTVDRDVFTNPSRCVDFEERHFNELAFDTNHRYQQVERLQHYVRGDITEDVLFPICPDETFEGIIPLSKNADQLKTAIESYVPTSFTSIHLGMKWGVSLLDPSMRTILERTNNVDPDFKGVRPADYDGDGSVVKYVILMTDGQNISGRRVEAEDYDEFEERQMWDQHPVQWWAQQDDVDEGVYLRRVTDPGTSADDQDKWLQQMCTLAKEEMTVYTIAMGAGEHGEEEMNECASRESTAFKTNFNTADGERGIDEIFEEIAKQITALRLSL